MARGSMGLLMLLVGTMGMVIASHGIEVDSPHQGDAVPGAAPEATNLAVHRTVDVYDGPNCGHRSQILTRAKVDLAADVTEEEEDQATPIKKLATSCAWELEHAIIGRKTKRKLEFSSRVCKGKLEVQKALFRSDGKPEGDKAVILSETLTPGQCVTPSSTAFPKMRAACRSAKIHCPQFEDESSRLIELGDAQGTGAKNSSSPAPTSAPTAAPTPCTTNGVYNYKSCASTSIHLDDGDLDTWYVWSSPTIELKCYAETNNPCDQGTSYCTASTHFPGLRVAPGEEIHLEYKVSCSACNSCQIYIRARTAYGNVPLSGWHPKTWTPCLDAYSQLSSVFSQTKCDIHTSCYGNQGNQGVCS